MSKGKKIAVGLGLGAAAASAGYYYFFGSKKAANNRKVAAEWAKKLKRDVIARAKKLKVLDEKVVKKIVSEASRAYAHVQAIDKRDLKRAVGELHDNWQAVKREALAAGKKVVRTAKKVTKKK